jgi:hypothetical protein
MWYKNANVIYLNNKEAKRKGSNDVPLKLISQSWDVREIIAMVIYPASHCDTTCRYMKVWLRLEYEWYMRIITLHEQIALESICWGESYGWWYVTAVLRLQNQRGGGGDYIIQHNPLPKQKKSLG